MPYHYTNSKGTTYCLHQRQTTLRNGAERTLYFFAKDEREGACDIPDGYECVETRNGLPVLKKDVGPVELIAPTPATTEDVGEETESSIVA